uniref:Uncharacterized protein n=1 Tax=Oryza brachyantha TaxID=4533 RepID=J3M513_ORYBR
MMGRSRHLFKGYLLLMESHPHTSCLRLTIRHSTNLYVVSWFPKFRPNLPKSTTLQSFYKSIPQCWLLQGCREGPQEIGSSQDNELAFEYHVLLLG